MICTHVPIVALSSGVHKHIAAGADIRFVALALVPPILAVAFVALRYFDEPLRAWLSGFATRRRVSVRAVE